MLALDWLRLGLASFAIGALLGVLARRRAVRRHQDFFHIDSNADRDAFKREWRGAGGRDDTA